MSIPSHLSGKIAKYLSASTAAHLSERLRHLDRIAEADDEQAASVPLLGDERRKRVDFALREVERVKANRALGSATDHEVHEAELGLPPEKWSSLK